MYDRAHKHNLTMVSECFTRHPRPQHEQIFCSYASCVFRPCIHIEWVLEMSPSDHYWWRYGYEVGQWLVFGWFWHHWGTMRGGGGSKIGRIGPGDKFSYTTGLCASIDHDSCRHPTAKMGPRSQHWSIQQSANILCNRSTFKTRFLLFINIYTTI